MIPYNPSSFNSNKTILEQIIELQNWLKEHPQYRIYCSSENGATLQVTYTLSNVTDNTDMDTGDVVLFANETIASVSSVDRDNNTFNVAGLQSIVGPQGPSGQMGYSIRVSTDNYVNDSTAYSRVNLDPSTVVRQGDTVIFANGYLGVITNVSGTNFYVAGTTMTIIGAPGVSITNAVIDASGHLIVTLSDGNTIDAGSVVTGTGVNIIQLTQYTGTLSADDLAIVNDPTQECIIDYYENSKHSFYFKDRQITGGWRFSNLDYVTGSHITIMWHIEIDSTTGAYLQDYTQSFIRAENINSYGATSGQVLTANGSNGASWQTPSGGSPTIVSFNDANTSGTFSSDDITKLEGDNTLLVSTSFNNTYRKVQETSSSMRYERIISDNDYINSRLIYIDKTTRAWNRFDTTTYAKPEGTDITSTGATSGQVLTSNGDGTASWQTPSGGGLEVIDITNITGTFSSSQLSVLQGNNAIIRFTNAQNRQEIYFKRYETTTTIVYGQIVQPGTTSLTGGYIEITISTRAYTLTREEYINVSQYNINSQTATNGQVLTANGSGGASWQNASGGSQLYQHRISFEFNNAMTGHFEYISNSATPISSYVDWRAILTTLVNLHCVGFVYDTNEWKVCTDFFLSGSNMYAVCAGTSAFGKNISITYNGLNFNVTDKVITL